jgi:hypothetical protein
MRRNCTAAPSSQDQLDEQEFHAVLTDCALPTDVSRVFDDYLTIAYRGAFETYLVVHKALWRR